MDSILSYIGGKSQLARKILPLVPVHKCYCEVFAGGSWVFFKKPESDVEIINDINTELVTLYRVVQNHLEEFIRYMKWTLTARDEYDRFKKMEPDAMTDIQRPVRFYYLIKNTFASKLAFDSFNVATTKRPRINLLRVQEDLSDAHIRLSRVYIENKPYEYIINRYDKPGVFFYIDPPYWNCENYYGKGVFSKQDFTHLRDLLANCQARFIMSINDAPEIRELYSQFNIREVETYYQAGGADKKKKVQELLIMNYDPNAVELAYPHL